MCSHLSLALVVDTAVHDDALRPLLVPWTCARRVLRNAGHGCEDQPVVCLHLSLASGVHTAVHEDAI